MTHIYKRNSSSRPLRRRTNTKYKKIPRQHQTGFRFKWRWLALIIVLIGLGTYVTLIDIQVREQFEGKRWALPARVYARPLELYTGRLLTPNAFGVELRSLGYRKVRQVYEPGQYQYRYKRREFLIATREFKFWDAPEPSRMVKVRFAGDQINSISELHPNRQMALLRLAPKLIGKIYPTHHEDRILVRLDDVPKQLIDATIAMEDRFFYEHYGISIRGTVRAFLANLKSGSLVQGGSTITQQLIKNFYLTPERSFKRKINEAIMAVLLEWHYSKEQILEAYLNEVHLGQDGSRAIHGMGMASRFYFNRRLNELKLPQLALLVSLIRGPSLNNPRKHGKRALKRRNLVIKLMEQQNRITHNAAVLAKSAPLEITKKATESVFPYPAFIEVVRHQLRHDYREKDLRSDGLQVFTTLNPDIQKVGEKVMKRGLRKLERKHRKARKLQGAMVITSSENGEILALINGKNPQYAGFNRLLNAERQIGSLAKVAVYLTALEKKDTYSLVSMLDDSPLRWIINPSTGETWKPKNYDFRSHGDTRLYRALAQSYNLATVRLGKELGLDSVYNTLKRLGIKREFKMYPSVLLGSLSLSPLEVTQMYQTIASGGFRVPVRAIRDVLNHEGKPLQRYPLSVEQRFDEEPIFLLNYALRQALRHGTGRRTAESLSSSMILAGKTGTSNGLRDSWFAGFGTELLAVTWVGRDDNKSMGLSGGNGAMVIWRDFMNAHRPKAVEPVVPDGIQWRSIDGERKNIPFIVGGQSRVNSALAGIGRY